MVPLQNRHLACSPDATGAKYTQSYLGVPVTGKYDQATKDAVAKYQKENGLKVMDVAELITKAADL